MAHNRPPGSGGGEALSWEEQQMAASACLACRAWFPALQELTDNAQRWSDFGDRANPRGPAAMCFRGDVYQGLEAWTLDARSLTWAQKHVRILSGLFGLLRPLDVIQPYRLEMGTKLKTDAGSNLYQFWGNAITKTLRKDMADAKAGTLVNLASDEYSKAIDFDGLGVDILQTTFLQRTGGKDKFISFHAKRARGQRHGGDARTIRPLAWHASGRQLSSRMAQPELEAARGACNRHVRRSATLQHRGCAAGEGRRGPAVRPPDRLAVPMNGDLEEEQQQSRRSPAIRRRRRWRHRWRQ